MIRRVVFCSETLFIDDDMDFKNVPRFGNKHLHFLAILRSLDAGESLDTFNKKDIEHFEKCCGQRGFDTNELIHNLGHKRPK